MYALHAAKVSKIPVRIFHAHGASITKDWKLPIKLVCKACLPTNMTHHFSCGVEAAKCYFGQKVVDENDYVLIPNAIDVARFIYNPKIRNKIRKENNLENKHVVGHAKKNDLKIIGAGDYKTFYDEGFIDLTPYEWVDLFRNAEKVITGTFHGTVFSIKYNKSVLCYPTEKNRINKIRSLLSDMKIASRLLEVGCEDDFIPLLDTPMDYTETRNYIAQKIQEADDFLTGDKS